MPITVGTSASRGTSMPLHQPLDKFGGPIGAEWGTRTIRIDYDGTNDDWRDDLPAIDAAHPANADLIFKTYSLTQLRNKGSLADLVLRYEQSEFSATPGAIPDDEVSENGAILEIDIVRHPKFDTANTDWNDYTMRDFYNPRDRRIFMSAEVPAEYIDENGKTQTSAAAGETVPEEIRGMDKYVVGTGTVTSVEYSATEPASVIDDVGKREKPTGYPGTDDNWLIMSARKTRRGAWWAKEYVHQFSEREISGFVYEDK